MLAAVFAMDKKNISACTTCQKEVSDEAKALQCHLCDEWTHIKCANVSSDMYKGLVSNPKSGLFHLCKGCLLKLDLVRKLVGKHPLTQSSPTESNHCGHGGSLLQDENINLVKRPRSQSQESRIIKSSSEKKIKSASSSPVKEQPMRPSTTPLCDNESSWIYVSNKKDIKVNKPKMTDPKKSVMIKNDVPQRERSVIILRAPESVKSSPEERMSDDSQFLSGCISRLFDEQEQGVRVISAFRLGKKHDDVATNPRPLKVIFETENEAQRVLKRTFRLRGESYYIVRDLSPEDRIKMRDALTELKSRRLLGEKNLRIVDFQVVVKSPKARWKPVFLVPTRS